jgi:hypothetical protein
LKYGAGGVAQVVEHLLSKIENMMAKIINSEKALENNVE